MRHLNYILIGALLLVCSCKARPSLQSTFNLTVKSISATKATIVIEPSNPEANYILGILSADMNYFNWTDKDNAAFQLDFIKEMMDYARADGQEIDFAAAYCYKGRWEDRQYYLNPDMDYKVIVFQVDPSTRQIIGEPCSTIFHTATLAKSDITFQFTWEADKLTITPSNNDQYCWDYEESDIILAEYATIDIYFESLVFMYEDYNFMAGVVNRGPVEWVFSKEDPTIREGDRCSLAISGYSTESGEITTDITTLEFIYHKDLPCELIEP